MSNISHSLKYITKTDKGKLPNSKYYLFSIASYMAIFYYLAPLPQLKFCKFNKLMLHFIKQIKINVRLLSIVNITVTKYNL